MSIDSRCTSSNKTDPVAKAKNITIQLDASGSASITTTDINDGSSDACGIASLALSKTSFNCANLGANTVTLTVKDVNGNESTATATVTVEDNINPVVKTKNITVYLSASGSVSISAEDVNNGSADNCSIESLALSKSSFTCANVGANTVSLTVTDSEGNSAAAPATVTVVDDVEPVVRTKNITIPLDANGKATITEASINDGSSDNCSISTLKLSQAIFDCTNIGMNTVILTVTDVNGNESTGSATVTVTNDDPTLGVISAPITPIQKGTVVTASATFEDSNINMNGAIWNWGDGSSSPGTISKTSATTGIITGTRTYSTPGVYTVTLTIKDVCDKTATKEFEYIVIYDPSGGFVTGGFWFNSLPGSYILNPALTGKANGGFVSKYQKGATVPTGNTQFQFQAANFEFNSTSYEWLVVAGAKAQYKGVGTINGSGNYGFMLSAIDGQVTGGGGVDKIRIKIWDKSNGDAVVYDNQSGASDDAVATTAIGGGSIVVHDGKSKTRIESESPVQERQDLHISAYPNPVADKVTIDLGGLSAIGVKTTLSDAVGKPVMQDAHKVTGESTLEIDMSGIKAGLYLIQLRSEQLYKIVKIIKQ